MQLSLKELELLFKRKEIYNRRDKYLLLVVNNIRQEIKIN